MAIENAGGPAILVADVGNTRIGLGIADAERVRNVTRVSSHDASEWPTVLRDTREMLPPGPVVLAVGSVAPQAAARFVESARETLDAYPLFVREDMPLPLPLDLENDREVGVDRVCSAAAAFERIKSACAIASLGTAITIDFVSNEGVFLGGTILPGLQMGCDALHERTAVLPRVEVHEPTSAMARNTRDAINSGVVYGAIGAIREIVERFATEAGAWPPLLATGGNAELIRERADFIDTFVPDLCLMGVALAYRKSRITG